MLAPIPGSGKETAYHRFITLIDHYKGSIIPVPELSRLLDVKTTTLNARFRREHLPVTPIGRTNYLSYELALRLAELHKYALLGWPTLREASRVTAIKPATIKARCEKGQLEGYLDLTKRLRINPQEIEKLAWPRSQNTPPATTHSPAANRQAAPPREPKNGTPRPVRKCVEWTPAIPRAPFLSPGSQPEVKLITEQDYGLPEAQPQVGRRSEPPRPPGNKTKASKYLSYDPDRPLSVAQCAVGKAIWYGPYEGRILKIFDDPFNPRIQVRFPGHELPVMREVCLIVEKRQK
jgi:hypothetical protein